MRSGHVAIVAMAMLTACTARADEKRQLAMQARSVVAEAALVVDLDRRGRLTKPYARQARAEARGELDSAVRTAGRASPELVASLFAAERALARSDAAALREIAGELSAMEGGDGRAD